MSPPRATPEPAQPVLPLDRSVGYQVRMTHRLVQRALQARIERHGVTLGMWYFLRVLWIEDGLTQSELSSLIGTMEPTTLSAVASMEAAGLVRRERHGTDKRKVNVFLTDKGRDLRSDLVPEAIAVVETAVRSMSGREVDRLLQMLKKVQANLAEELQGSTRVAKRPRKPPRNQSRPASQP